MEYLHRPYLLDLVLKLLGDQYKKVQNKLNELGYDCGNADGNMGEKTKKSIEQFQKDNGLTVDGKLGSKTLKTLGI